MTNFSCLIILREGFLAEGIGILISILIGFIIGLIYRISLVEPTAFIIARGEPNLVNLIIAIASGLTAGICFVSGTSLALVGVAAAAALLPVSVNVGIAFGFYDILTGEENWHPSTAIGHPTQCDF